MNSPSMITFMVFVLTAYSVEKISSYHRYPLNRMFWHPQRRTYIYQNLPVHTSGSVESTFFPLSIFCDSFLAWAELHSIWKNILKQICCHKHPLSTKSFNALNGSVKLILPLSTLHLHYVVTAHIQGSLRSLLGTWYPQAFSKLILEFLGTQRALLSNANSVCCEMKTSAWYSYWIM